MACNVFSLSLSLSLFHVLLLFLHFYFNLSFSPAHSYTHCLVPFFSSLSLSLASQSLRCERSHGLLVTEIETTVESEFTHGILTSVTMAAVVGDGDGVGGVGGVPPRRNEPWWGGIYKRNHHHWLLFPSCRPSGCHPASSAPCRYFSLARHPTRPMAACSRNECVNPKKLVES